MRLQRCGILIGVLWPYRYATKTETAQQIANRAFGQRYTELPLDLASQIDAPPANHPVFGKLRPGAHPLRHRR